MARIAPAHISEAAVANAPTVSVVIIFLNAERFMAEAVESVIAQTFEDWELLLVDDGSNDRSTGMALSYTQRYQGKIHYLEHSGHQNRGMSASRNLGIRHARGEFVAMLDADDVWLPQKLLRQVAMMRRNPEAGLLASPAIYLYEDGAQALQPMTLSPGLLRRGAWIPKILESDDNAACPSSVLIRTGLLRHLTGFEESFRGPLMVFEDQVTWFKINLAAPIYYDPEALLLYRIHSASCCVSTPSDQQVAARTVLYSHLTELLDNSGKSVVKEKLLSAMVRIRLCETLLQSSNPSRPRAEDPEASSPASHFKQRLNEAQHGRAGLLSYALLLLSRVSAKAASAVSSRTFDFFNVAYHEGAAGTARRILGYSVRLIRKAMPKPVVTLVRSVRSVVRKVRARFLLTTGVKPVSELWAFDRGVPIHRHYLTQFLQEYRSDVRGHCLEFQEDSYTTRIGGSAVTKLDILHIDHTNRRATIVADLTQPNEIPTDCFDCIICTHVLHVIPELDKVVSEMYRILKPGGTLLAAVPQVSMCDPGWHELWRFTPQGLGLLLAKAFGHANVSVRGYGNSLTSAAEIRGLASDELTCPVLEYHDPRFAVEVCARALKPNPGT